ncbi:MAG: hypothetical protein NZ651_04990 [Candidatus Bipolaricaulota bacterium]|nr:hypothetical protein [Candidatus Bipolaricaulota bacterium]MDW8127109.1 hypothetical protein [Candidatus Bipolaricaulota bacterium]
MKFSIINLLLASFAAFLGFGYEKDACLRCSPAPEFSPVLVGCDGTLVAVHMESVRSLVWGVGVSRSVNGGETFEYLGELRIPDTCQECSQGWPALVCAPDGSLYLALVSGDQNLVLRSRDFGKTFFPVFSILSSECPACLYPSIFISLEKIYLMVSEVLQKRVLVFSSDLEGKRRSSTVVAENAMLGKLIGYKELLYSAFIRWKLPVDLVPPLGIPDRLAPLGDLLVQYCRLHPAELVVAFSSDEGQTWGISPPLALINVPAKVSEQYASFIYGGLEAPFIVNPAIDPHTGNIYFTFPGANEEGDMDVYVFGVNANLEVILPPTRVRKEPGKERFLPNIAIAPNGVIGVAFYELDKTELQIDVWFGVSMDGGQTFDCQRLNAVPSPIPPVVMQLTRSGHFDPSMPPGYIGESIGIWADRTFFYMAWTDFRNRIVTHDYPQGRPDMDLYFVRVSVP